MFALPFVPAEPTVARRFEPLEGKGVRTVESVDWGEAAVRLHEQHIHALERLRKPSGEALDVPLHGYKGKKISSSRQAE